MPTRKPKKKVKKMPTKTVTSIKMSKTPRTLAANNEQAKKAVSTVAKKSYKKSFPSLSNTFRASVAMRKGDKVAAKIGRSAVEALLTKVDWEKGGNSTTSKIKKSPSKAVGYTTKISSTSKYKKRK
jgi:hypothetical protein